MSRRKACVCRHCGKEYTAPVQSDHRLLCGDATNPDDVSRLLDGQSAALCFTSPPYNAGDNRLGGNRCRQDSKYLRDADDRPQDEYRDFLVKFTDLALRHCQTVAVNLQMLAGNKLALVEWLYHFRRHLVDRLVWHKGAGQPAMAANVLNSRCEDVWLLSPQDLPSRAIPTARFHGTVSNVYEGRGASGENTACAIHAATMPMHFALHCLTVFDGSGGLVYEPFAGSGTTVIAAEKLGRRCAAMEIEPLYCDTVIARYEQFTGKKAIRSDFL